MITHTRKDLHMLRRAWHVVGGVIMHYLYEFFLDFTQAVTVLSCVFGLCLLFEIGRLYNPSIQRFIFSVMGPLLRKEEEHKFTGTFLFICGALISLLCFPKPIALLGVLYLAFGDPIASIVGGQIEIPFFRLPSGKSLHGTLAAVLICSYVTYASLNHSWNAQFISTATLWNISIIGGLVGGLSEQIPFIDDNIIIPVMSASVLSVAFYWLGINPNDVKLCLGCAYQTEANNLYM